MLQSLLEQTAKSLDKHGLPYMVIGGQAAFVHGEPRASNVIGIALGIGPDKIDELCEVMREVGLTSLADSPKQYAKESYVLPCVHEGAGIRVGFIFTLTGYEARAIQHAIPRKVGETVVLFAAPEDLVIERLFAGGAQDLADARAIIERHKGINIDYIRETVRELDRAADLSLLARFDALIAGRKNAE